ncbi:cell wall-binding repeat-containing protein [Stomatohabitans albus]
MAVGLLIPLPGVPFVSPAPVQAQPPAVNAPPVVKLPDKTVRCKQAEPCRTKLDITDDSTPVRDLKVAVETEHKATVAYESDGWYLSIDTTNYTSTIDVFVTATDTEQRSTTAKMRVGIRAAVPYMHPTVDRYGRIGKAIDKILVHVVDIADEDVDGTHVEIEGLPPGLVHNPVPPNPNRKLITYIEGTPTKAGVYTVTERLINKTNNEINRLSFKITVLEPNAPRVPGAFDVPIIKATKGDELRNAFPIQHHSGEFPLSELKFEADNPLLSLRRAHLRWQITLNTKDAVAPTPVKITMVEPDGVRTDQWTTLQVDDPALKTRALLGVPETVDQIVNTPIQPFTIKVENPVPTDVIEVKGLPEGVTFDAASRTVRGTPTKVGTFSAVVAFRDATGAPQDAKRILFTIKTPSPVPPPAAPLPNPTPTPTPTPNPSPGPAGTVEGTRVSGPTRVETAVAISQQRYGDKQADTVVLARADQVADAVASTPLAYQAKAPVLLTQSDQLHPATLKELQRVLKPSGKMLLMGQHVAISEQVQTELATAFPQATIERIGGVNRFATSVEIYRKLNQPGTVALVDADNRTMADALVAGTAMAQVTDGGKATPGAILYTSLGNIPPETQALLGGTSVKTRYAYERAIADQAKATLIAGSNSAERAVTTAQQFFKTVPAVALTSGKEANTVDALAGGVDAAQMGAPLLLVLGDGHDGTLRTYLSKLVSDQQLKTVRAYGGPEAINQASLEGLFGKDVTLTWNTTPYKP